MLVKLSDFIVKVCYVMWNVKFEFKWKWVCNFNLNFKRKKYMNLEEFFWCYDLKKKIFYIKFIFYVCGCLNLFLLGRRWICMGYLYV